MAADSMVIVQFEALENAIQSFTSSAGRISELAGQLRSNAQAIQACVESTASSTYIGKQNSLATNVDSAQEALMAKVNVLQQLLDGSIDAESAAERIAEGVNESASSFSMS